MSFDQKLQEYRKFFRRRGTLILQPHGSITKEVENQDVADGYGVYVVFGNRGANRSILYIGKGGTALNDGTFKKQGIRGRLTKKQGKRPREEVFPEWIETIGLDTLEIEWFVTFDNDRCGPKVLPCLAEA